MPLNITYGLNALRGCRSTKCTVCNTNIRPCSNYFLHQGSTDSLSVQNRPSFLPSFLPFAAIDRVLKQIALTSSFLYSLFPPSFCTRVRTSKLLSGFNGPQEMVARSARCRTLSYTVSRTHIGELKPHWLQSGAGVARLWYTASGRPVCIWRNLEYACSSDALICLWGYFCLGIIMEEDKVVAFFGTQGWHEKQNISRKTWSKVARWKT